MRTAFPAYLLSATGFWSISFTVKSWIVPAATVGLAPPKNARVEVLIALPRGARRATFARNAAVEADMVMAAMGVTRATRVFSDVSG